jgi:hypothetical protein
MWTTATATKTYPLGKGSTYRALQISLTTPASPVVRAELFNANAGGNSSLNAISTVRYFQTSLLGNTAEGGGSVTIQYGADDGVQDHTTLVVAQGAIINGTYLTLGRTASDASSVTSGTGYNPVSGDFLLLGSTGSNTLPIELTSFVATATRNSATIEWRTATEANSASFELDRKVISNQLSAVGGWKTIATVQAAGFSNSPKSYSVQDAGLTPGKYAYRLKEVSVDGTTRYIGNTEVDIFAAWGFKLNEAYPNPFNPSTNISFTVETRHAASLRVFNLLGQRVATLFDGIAEAGVLYERTFSPQNLPSGMYFSQLESNGQRSMKRLMLVK